MKVSVMEVWALHNLHGNSRTEVQNKHISISFIACALRRVLLQYNEGTMKVKIEYVPNELSMTFNSQLS